MPLTLTATPGDDEANSYVTVEEALEYASYRIGGDVFAALTDDQQIQALVTAAYDIDTLFGAFLGDPLTSTQAMEWPRDSLDGIPEALKRAQIELAISYAPAFVAGYTGDVLNQNHADGNVKRKKIDVLETEWFSPRSTEATALARFPDVVQRLLALLLEPAFTGWGGSAVVSRGS